MPDPTPTALDALLVRVGRAADLIDDTRYGKAPLESVESHGTLANAAPRLAAIVRVLRGGLDRYAGIASGCLASVGGDAARTALARAEAIARGG